MEAVSCKICIQLSIIFKCSSIDMRDHIISSSAWLTQNNHVLNSDPRKFVTIIEHHEIFLLEKTSERIAMYCGGRKCATPNFMYCEYSVRCAYNANDALYFRGLYGWQEFTKPTSNWSSILTGKFTQYMLPQAARRKYIDHYRDMIWSQLLATSANQIVCTKIFWSYDNDPIYWVRISPCCHDYVI